MPQTLVAIPVYNEEKYVSEVLHKVQRYAEHILVIDDGSTDNTPSLLAQQRVDVIRHAENRGYGRSIRDAFRAASCYGYDWLITMDCDEQHEPASLPDFFAAIERDHADLLSGTRYSPDSPKEHLPPRDRRRINHTITQLLNNRLGTSITDAFCGYKAYRVAALDKLELSVDGYAMPIQFWVQAAAHDLNIEEVPIRLIYNDANRSFGGPLDDPDKRLAYYHEILHNALEQFPDKFRQPCECHVGA